MPKQPITHSVKDLPLVAVELGSHSVRAMAAEKVGNDLLRVLAYEESSQFPCVNRGMVEQMNDAGFMINHVLHLLANRLKLNDAIPSAYTLIGGKGMTLAAVKSKRDLIRRRSITEQIKEEMKQECADKIERRNPDVAVFDVLPSYYVLDGVEQDNEPTDEQKASVWEIHLSDIAKPERICGKVSRMPKQPSKERSCDPMSYSVPLQPVNLTFKKEVVPLLIWERRPQRSLSTRAISSYTIWSYHKADGISHGILNSRESRLIMPSISSVSMARQPRLL